MAFFQRTPTTPENCVMVLEAKGLGEPLAETLLQPRRYVEQHGLGGVRYLVTTDGATLFLYERPGAEWRADPVGYLDVMSLQKTYLLPGGTDLVKTLVRLQPGAV